MGIFDDIKESLTNFFVDLTTNYQKSNKWKEYHLGFGKTHGWICLKRNSKIYLSTEVPYLPEHEKCACYLDWLRKIKIGSATKIGKNGADYYIHNYRTLPNYYITKETAYSLG